MKLKYLFPIFIAILALFASCDDEDQVTLLGSIQVSSSYVSIPLDGGSTNITVTAKDSWTAEKVFVMKNDSVVKDSISWLTLSTITGSAGESTLSFSAESSLNGRSAEVLIQCGGETQRVNVMQGVSKAAPATCAEVIAGPESKTYRVTGVCTAITNTTYGNWILTDETGSITIYGTLDEDGKEKNFLSWNLAVGDEVTVEGPKTLYGTTVELVKVTVININKSLIKIDSTENATLPIEGGKFTAYLKSIGQGVSVEIPEDAKSWLAISSIETEGINSVVTFTAATNTGGERSTTIKFRTTDGSKESSVPATLTQKGAISEVSIAEFLAAEVGDTEYRLSGVVTSISDATSGKLYLSDFSGKTYVYKIQDFAQEGIKEGDIITIVGKRAAYNESPQVSGAVLKKVIPVTPASITEILAKPDDSNTYFMVTGEITSIDDVNSGKLYLKDEDSQIYVYKCYPGYGATGDDRNGLLATKGIKVGDALTIIGTRGSYNGTDELLNSIYFSHVSAQ